MYLPIPMSAADMFSGFVFLVGVLGVVMDRAMSWISRGGRGGWLLRTAAVVLVIVLAAVGAACDSISIDVSTETPATPTVSPATIEALHEEPRELTIASHDSFNIGEDVIEAALSSNMM